MSEIPRKCLDCPSVKYVQEIIEAHELEEAEFLQQLASDDLDRQAERLFQNGSGFGEMFGAHTPEKLTEVLRISGSKRLEMSEQHTESHRQQLAKIVLNCLGVMRLQGSDDDTLFTVTACASPEIPRDMGPLSDTVTIDRQRNI